MKEFLSKYKHAWILSYFFIYLAWFFALENHVTTDYTSIYMRLDDYIPFNEWFVIPYVLWFAYVAVTIIYFFFTSKDDYYKITAFLFIGMTICLIIYTIWPNGQDLRPTTFERDNFLVDIVKMFYSNDTSTNVCPSIHVFNSIGVHIAIAKSEKLKRHKWLVASSFVLMVLISLATVFLKQHSAFDGICAIALSGVMYLVVYKIQYDKLFAKVKEVFSFS